ncbi:hypothetical protein GF380_04685, partial [Candidatus Uhrbacteria bacterium]|nr:hypothetical protein [Candidatus Uhrbacteria bacterium]MBD3284352.1 hypothetical protein [Candidatus Uhrbacteria bacterium]
VELGVDGVELDIRLTKDQKPVIVHDADLRRIAGDNRYVEDLTLAELKRVPLRHGSSIPTMDEVTGCVPDPCIIDFEVKDARVLDQVIRKLNTSKGLRSRALISSFQPTVIEEAKRLLPEVPRLCLLKRWPVRTWRFSEWLSMQDVWGVAQIYTALNEPRIRWLKSLEIRVGTWEPFGLRSSQRRARRLARMGIDLAIVNQPQCYQRAGEHELE